MRLARRPRPLAAITLTPLVDVMLILLVFFMVTSTYLDLDMIPMGAEGEAPGAAAAPAAPRTLLVRLDASGRAAIRGREMAPGALAAALRESATGGPLRVLILPSPLATAQDLVAAMEAAARAGIAEARVVRIEGAS